jgi:hypothetical protein
MKKERRRIIRRKRARRARRNKQRARADCAYKTAMRQFNPRSPHYCKAAVEAAKRLP